MQIEFNFKSMGPINIPKLIFFYKNYYNQNYKIENFLQ
jgi:hypothetical protein